MPIGINAIELLRYFTWPEGLLGKSVQREWLFYGLFFFNPFKGIDNSKSFKDNEAKVGEDLINEFPPVIQSFHLLDVTIPAYKFKKEEQMYGQVPRSFPVLDFEGFNLQMTLEEDEHGSVDYFINWNQRNIISSEGYYTAPSKVKLDLFVLEVQDKNGIPIVYYLFHDIFYLTASDVTYSYTSTGTVKRQLTFGCDRMSTIYIKQNAVSFAAEAALAGVELATHPG